MRMFKNFEHATWFIQICRNLRWNYCSTFWKIGRTSTSLSGLYLKKLVCRLVQFKLSITIFQKLDTLWIHPEERLSVSVSSWSSVGLGDMPTVWSRDNWYADFVFWHHRYENSGKIFLFQKESTGEESLLPASWRGISVRKNGLFMSLKRQMRLFLPGGWFLIKTEIFMFTRNSGWVKAFLRLLSMQTFLP